MKMSPFTQYSPTRSSILFTTICILCIISLLTEKSTQPIQKLVKESLYFITTPVVLLRNYLDEGIDLVIDAIFLTEKIQAENRTLKEELTRLRLSLIEKNEKIKNLEKTMQLEEKVQKALSNLELIPATVVEVYQGTLRIDKGSKDGIKILNGVIAPNGVVGIIIETAPHTSVVATLHHKNCKIGAMVERTRLRAYDGVIFPAGDLKKICTMNYIDIYNTIKIGDLIVTSPESVFPAGIPIGKIQAIHETGTMWKTADITPLVDPYALDRVYIILSKPEPLDFAYTQKLTTRNSDDNQQLPIQELLAP